MNYKFSVTDIDSGKIIHEGIATSVNMTFSTHNPNIRKYEIQGVNYPQANFAGLSLAGVPVPNPPSCAHSHDTYNGLSETYNFCKFCGVRE